MAEKRKVRVACDEEEIGKVEPGFCGLLIAPEKSSATAPTTSGFASLERYPENEYSQRDSGAEGLERHAAECGRKSEPVDDTETLCVPKTLSELMT